METKVTSRKEKRRTGDQVEESGQINLTKREDSRNSRERERYKNKNEDE